MAVNIFYNVLFGLLTILVITSSDKIPDWFADCIEDRMSCGTFIDDAHKIFVKYTSSNDSIFLIRY